MPRTYTSDVRAEQSRRTRAAILEAAAQLFLEQGWVATTMARVGERSGVARQTVYLLFPSKLALLDACIDAALLGGGSDATGGAASRVRDLPGYRRMAEGTFDVRVRAGAEWLAGAHQRSARIQRVLDEAAVGDPVAAARLAEREQTRWREVRWAMTLVLADPEPDPAVVDGVWTLASRDVWLKLVGQRGWTSEAWQEWFAGMLAGYRGHATDE